MINFLRKVKFFIQGNYVPIKIHNFNKKWYGNNYGGFFLYPNTINESSVIYSIGIGEDISFDNEIIDDFGCKVFAFDPTPKSVKWVERFALNKNFIFKNIGIANQKGKKEFFLPKHKNHVSGSIHKIKTIDASDSIELNFDTLPNIMKLNGHNKIDVLKMDIEGSEYEVIEDIKNFSLNINQILVEFHPHFERDGKKKTIHAIKTLQNMGFRCFGRSTSLLEYSFIKLD